MTDPILIQQQIKEMEKNMDIDKETVQIVAIIGGVAVGIAALIFDGELGLAMGLALTNAATGAVAYIFGTKRCEDAKEIEG